jgi:flavin reductase (DIM6/NTAB) family NADH-FMN oxidoreductase RutF
MDVNIKYVQKITSPHPFALISTQKADGSTNLMAVSWWTYVSNNPTTIVVSVSKKSFTNKLICQNKEFGLNIVNESMKKSAFKCGTRSGDKINKPELFNIDLLEPSVISTKLVSENKVALECKLVGIHDSSDHSIFVAEVVASHCNPERNHLYSFDGYRRLDTV